MEEITGLNRQTLQDYKWVAENIPSSRRYEDLGFSHHVEVAKLPEAKQIAFLIRASEEILTKTHCYFIADLITGLYPKGYF